MEADHLALITPGAAISPDLTRALWGEAERSRLPSPWLFRRAEVKLKTLGEFSQEWQIQSGILESSGENASESHRMTVATL